MRWVYFEKKTTEQMTKLGRISRDIEAFGARGA